MLWVIISMLFFALSHTWLAGQTFKDKFKKHFGERAFHGLYRLLYNIFSVIVLGPILLYVYLQTGRVIWIAPELLEPVLLLIQLCGLIGVGLSLAQINLGRFLGISQLLAYIQRKPLPLAPEKLTTSGVYAISRHPLYLFSLMILWPVTAMTELLFVFNIAATIYFVIGSRYEERRLIMTFGQDYVDYQKRVPWLLPFPRPNG